jgi:hypothetical protein
MVLEAETITLLSANGVDVSLKPPMGAVCWDYDSYIAFDIEEKNASVCINGTKRVIEPAFTDPLVFVYRDGDLMVRWRITNKEDAFVLTLLFLEGSDVKGTLVVTATKEHTGFEMTNNLLYYLKKLQGGLGKWQKAN